MARTKKGSKGPGFEYWTKRPGNKHGGLLGAFQKHYTHKIERQQNKPTQTELADAMTDLAEMRDKCGDPHCEYCGTPNDGAHLRAVHQHRESGGAIG